MDSLVSYERILSSEAPLLDVRSPIEFHKGHLAAAVNIPIFSDQERAIIGTIYKQIGKEKAIEKCWNYVTPKIQGFVEEARTLAGAKGEVFIYCWRGGMRSQSFTDLLNSSGLKAKRIDGGYKAARGYIRHSFSQKANIVLLGGYTGSGKTDYLKAIGEAGFQILDLEALANHKGSSFGHINEMPQPTNEQFENDLFAKWALLDLSKPVIVEHESNAIGKVRIPEPLFFQMKKAPMLVVEVPLGVRLDRLERDYNDVSGEQLIESCRRIQSKLGGERYQNIVALLNLKDYRSAASLLLDYYDKFYRYALEQKVLTGGITQVSLSGSSMANDLSCLIKRLNTFINENNTVKTK